MALGTSDILNSNYQRVYDRIMEAARNGEISASQAAQFVLELQRSHRDRVNEMAGYLSQDSISTLNASSLQSEHLRNQLSQLQAQRDMLRQQAIDLQNMKRNYERAIWVGEFGLKYQSPYRSEYRVRTEKPKPKKPRVVSPFEKGMFTGFKVLAIIVLALLLFK